MKNTLGIFLLSGLLIVSNVIAQNLPTAPGQAPVTRANVPPGWRGGISESIADAPAELKAIIGDKQQMEQYVATNPDSIYVPRLQNILASSYRQTGRLTPALNDWSAAWQELKTATNSSSYNEASHALAGQLELLTSLGQVETLPDLLKAAEARTITDPEDRRRIEMAREGYATMLANPSLNYRCGTLALTEIARMQGKPASVINALIEDPSPKEGVSLLRLVELSRQFNLGMVAVKRTDHTPLPVPCIVHWAQNHYGALLEYHADSGLYRVIFGDPNWISAPDMDAESSGYFLIPADQRPASWPLVSDAECANVLGRSYIYTINDNKDKGCKVDPTSPNAKCPSCDGMPAWWVTEPYINVFLADEPVKYTTSRGSMDFRVTVKQRDSVGNLFAYPRPGFLHNWYSRIFIQGMPVTTTQYATNYYGIITTNILPVLVTNGFAHWTATVDLGTGGQITYNSSTNSIILFDEETKTRLVPAYGVLTDGTQYPIPGYPFGGSGVSPNWTAEPIAGNSSEYNYLYWNDGSSGFRIIHSDGSIDRYGLTYWRSNGLSGYYESEALLTQKTDPLGNNVNLFYQLYTNSIGVFFRLTQVVDCDNKTNTFAYASNTSSNIQQIVTPYNQVASFGYDSSGNLTNVTDAVTNSSGLTWDSNGRVSTLNTPYGTTRFNYYDQDLPGTNDSSVNGDYGTVNRAVTVSDPSGGTNIYVYSFNASAVASMQFATNVIPQSTPLGTLDTGTNTLDHNYAAASWRNSYHWNAMQTAALSTVAVTNLTSTDYKKARMQHWLGDANNVSQTSLLSIEQDPSSDGTTPGQLTFYDYYGKTTTYLQGTNSQIAVIARRQPSGATEYDWKQYNSDGYVTKDISTYTLADNVVRTRTNTFLYALNTISFVLSNNAVGLEVAPYYWLDDGLNPVLASQAFSLSLIFETGYGSNGYAALVSGLPFNYCGAWSTCNAGVTSIPLANLLVASINAFGATNSYGGFVQANQSITTHNYTAWYVSYQWLSDPWQQVINTTYTVPIPTKITNAVGYVSTITLDGSNRVTSVHSFAGLTTTNSYSTNGFLSKVVDIEIGRTNTYTYANGLINTEQNERGLTTTYTWDNLQRLISKSDSEGYISNVYSRLDLTAVKDKLGGWAYFGFDPLQHMVTVTNANKEVKLAAYCSCGALEWTRDAITNYTQYGYDLAGRLTSIQYPDGYIVNNTYNALNQLIKTSDLLGYVTNTYNLQGLLTQSANNVGIVQSNSYDILDRAQAITDNRGIVTSLSYDALNRVLTNIVAGTLTNSFVYSNNGLVKSTDGLRTNYTYFLNDPLGCVLARTNANSEVTRFYFDSSGNATNIVDGKLQNTWLQYDAFNRLTNKLDNNQVSMLQLTYDANSQIKTRWTPEKGTTTYIRDPVGRVRTNSYPHDPQVVFAYDPNGHLTNMADAIGTTASTYSSAGQLLTDGGLWTNDVVTRIYNNQLRTSLTLGSIQTTYNYDAAHRLYNISAGSGNYYYTFHAGFGGNYSSPLIQKLSLPNSMSVTNGYESAGRLAATVLLYSNQVPFDSEQYVYDADGVAELPKPVTTTASPHLPMIKSGSLKPPPQRRLAAPLG